MTQPARRDTRQEILQAAQELFREQGYDATSLRQIAAELAITKAALYYHFPAKDDIIVALARPFLDALEEFVEAVRAQGGQPTIDRAERILDDYLALFQEHHAVVHLLVQDLSAANHPEVGLRGRRLVDTLQAELTGPDASPEDRIRVGCAFSAAHFIAELAPDAVAASRPTVLAAALAALRCGR